MSQKIYLARHGEVVNNVIFDLNRDFPAVIAAAKHYLKQTHADPEWKHHQSQILSANSITRQLLTLVTGITREQLEERGITENVLHLERLTAKGREQAVILGQYLHAIGVNPGTAVYVTSSKSRTHETLKLATKPFFNIQYTPYPELDEVAPLELIVEKGILKNEKCPKEVKQVIKSRSLDAWREYVKHNQEEARELVRKLSNLYHDAAMLLKKVGTRVALRDTYIEIGTAVSSKLSEIVSQTSKDVVAIMHGNINVCLLKHLGFMEGIVDGTKFSNCG
ncbi:histidine phosphatase family protein, partial [Candidatus Woesearchaeota archaeon]|nr:histidine phosphatase family protein [Candidatus Woesearchaeota archaeon]